MKLIIGALLCALAIRFVALCVESDRNDADETEEEFVEAKWTGRECIERHDMTTPRASQDRPRCLAGTRRINKTTFDISGSRLMPARSAER